MIEPNLDCERNDKGNCKKPFKPAPGPGAGRQAGSSFKAFALAAALKEGVPLSKVFDVSGSSVTIPGADNGADYTVQNYEGSSYGKMSLLEATVQQRQRRLRATRPGDRRRERRGDAPRRWGSARRLLAGRLGPPRHELDQPTRHGIRVRDARDERQSTTRR